MAKTVIFGNQKGGVAKTTSTYNVGACLARLGKKVLMIDLDPQASLTMICGYENPEIFDGRNISTLLSKTDNVNIKNCIIKLDFNEKYQVLAQDEGKKRRNIIITDNLDLIPSDLSLSSVEYEMFSRMKRDEILTFALEEIQDEYDFILIDCPPSLGLLTVNAFVACNSVIACVEPQYQSIRGLEFYKNSLATMKRDTRKRDVEFCGVLITKILSNGKDIDEYQNIIAETNNILARVPHTVAVSALDAYGIPVVYNRPSIQPSLEYEKVARYLIS